MVGNLKGYRRDPGHKGRGSGSYWHRGKGIYSKYTGDIDKYVHAKKIKGYRKRTNAHMGDSGTRTKKGWM